MDRTWNEIITEVIAEKNRPLICREIIDAILLKGWKVSEGSMRVTISLAVKSKVLAYIKVPPRRAGYYCNPQWLNEKGELKEEYKFDPFFTTTADEHTTN